MIFFCIFAKKNCMKRTLSYILLLIAGIAIGATGTYLAGVHLFEYTAPKKITENNPLEQTQLSPKKDKRNTHKAADAENSEKQKYEAVQEAEGQNSFNEDTDSLLVTSVADTLNESYTLTALPSNDEVIRVKKDELISSFRVKHYVLDETETENKLIDSLVVGEFQKKSEETFYVEIWASPLNYRGYKMSRQKLMLFGLDPLADYYLFTHNDIRYLKYGNVFYKLEYTDGYTTYQNFTDKSLINKFNHRLQ